MKKIALLLIISFTLLQTGFSCTCVGGSQTFCDEASSIAESQIIVRIRIEKREGSGGQARILNLYKGIEDKRIIQIWGGNGGDCTMTLGSVGQVFIMILNRYEQLNQSNSKIKVGDYKSGFICGRSQLSVENGKIIGSINSSTKSESITDSDPTTLFFCSQLLADKRELDKIKIFPNPTSNEIIVKGINAEMTIHVYDVLGRYLFEKLITVSDNKVVLNNLASGVYIIRFRKNDAIKGLKFVKIE